MSTIITQIIEEILSHIPVLFIATSILLFFLALCNIDIKPPTIKMVDKFNSVRITSICLGSLFLIIGLLLLFLPSFPSAGFRSGLTSTTNSQGKTPGAIVITPLGTKTPSAPQDDSASSLIPAGKQPVINDPLKDNSEGYQWDVQSDANGNCDFVQGHYLLTERGGDSGIGCQAEDPTGTFRNFVYQIQMTILTGVDNGQAGAGVTFRTNTSGTGQQYQVLFNVNGIWEIGTDAKDFVGGMCANPCPHFHVGLNQSNYITVRASNNLIQVQINGYDLGSYMDSTYTSGAIGVQLSPGTDNSSVAFSNVRVWQL